MEGLKTNLTRAFKNKIDKYFGSGDGLGVACNGLRWLLGVLGPNQAVSEWLDKPVER